MLSVYIEDKYDEGSYQCVDSKSDTPIKKTIKLFLSKQIFLLFLGKLNYFCFFILENESNQLKVPIILIFFTYNLFSIQILIR